MKFWAIETESLGGSMREVKGPFETRAAAEAFIRRDFADWWDNSEIPLADRDDECSSTWLVLQELAEVRPVAKTTLKTVLVEVKD
jgi:hypothetical protein